MMSEEDLALVKKHLALRKQQVERETKSVSLHTMPPDYTEKNRQAHAKQRPEEANSSNTEPVTNEDEHTAGSFDGEPDMMPDDQHPAAMRDGDDAKASRSDIARPLEDNARNGIGLEEAVEERPGSSNHFSPPFIQGGTIVRNRSQQLVSDNHSQKTANDGRWQPKAPGGWSDDFTSSIGRNLEIQGSPDSDGNDPEMRMAKSISKREYDEEIARTLGPEVSQDVGDASKPDEAPLAESPGQSNTSKLEIPVYESRPLDPYDPDSEPENLTELKTWFVAQIQTQLRDQIVIFPVRIHLVGTNDEIHEIVGVHRDIPLRELKQLIYQTLEMKEELSDMELDARWMSDADWKFICDSTPSSVLGADSDEGGAMSPKQPVWAGNRHTLITSPNCANVLNMLKIRKGKDFISVQVIRRDDFRDAVCMLVDEKE
ncbi:hypothetical protein E2P81_ATG00474 [Venturia nashicola]|nr:hypothetical protein E2P81_ATG00474 [Venturia nashicola]